MAIGASGPAAGLVVPELAKRGAVVRGFIRDVNDTDAVRKRGAKEIAIGDLRDEASLIAALAGVDAIFYIPPTFMRNEADVGLRVVAAARAAGVRRFVFSSVIDPVLGLVNHRAKVPVEEAIVNSGMEYTLLHPTVFFQNIARTWARVVPSGVFAEPWSNETKFSRVDYRDVAEAAAIALTDDRLLFGTFELCADGILNRYDVASMMSEVTGTTIRAEKLDPEVALSGAPDDAARAGMKAMFEYYDSHGLVGNALTLRGVLEREPRTLRAYLEELASRG